MAGKHKHSYPSDEALIAAVTEYGSITEVARQLGIPYPTLASHLDRRKGLRQKLDDARSRKLDLPEDPAGIEQGSLADKVHLHLKKRSMSVEELSDALDVPPRRVREAIGVLQHHGFRIPDETDPTGAIGLQKLVPEQENLHTLDPKLLDGDVLRIGVVSDTHLNSNEEALPELHLAYDTFQEQGISEVWHCGDLVAGRGIFRTQDAEIRNHTYESQVGYAVENYPKRDGIRTRMISGNHDIEGDFGKIGADPVRAFCNQREDVDYLGAYSAWIELPNGGWQHLLHGKGGMSYAYSYKAQKLVDGYPSGRKPTALFVGHWHVSGWIEARGVQVLWPSCFEWQSPFMQRLGLTPSVGFNIVEMTLGEDGSLVRFTPTFYRFWQGRVVAS